jgi:hypothetical protein
MGKKYLNPRELYRLEKAYQNSKKSIHVTRDQVKAIYREKKYGVVQPKLNMSQLAPSTTGAPRLPSMHFSSFKV